MKNLLNKVNNLFLLFNLFFLQSYLIRFNIGSYPTNLQELFIFILAIIFIANLLAQNQLRTFIKESRNYWPILGLLILAMMALLQGGEDITFMVRYIKFIFFGSTLALIFFGTLKTSAEKNDGLRWTGLGALAFGLFSLIYNLLGHNVAHDYRLIGPLDAAVYLAFYLTPFFIYFTISAFKGFHKKEFIIYAVLLFILILGTRSMGSIGGSIAIIIVWLIGQHKPKIIYSSFGKILIIIVTLITLALITWTKIIPTLTTSYSSLDERGEIWKVSVELMKEPKNIFLGVGLGQFQNEYETHADKILGYKPLDYYVLQPHNIFLLFIFNFGVLGLAFLIYCIWKSISHSSRTSTWILWYFLLHGLIDTPFFKNDLFFIFMIFLSLALLSEQKSNLQKL